MMDINRVQVSPDGTLLALSGFEFSLIDGLSGNDPVQFYNDLLWAGIEIINLETDEPVLESDHMLYAFEWMPDSSALVGRNDAGLLDVLPINGAEAYPVEGASNLPDGWDFMSWENDTVFLAYLGYGTEIELDGAEIGIWAVNIATGEVERRL
jgi:hypothetical protein